jgi:hypothetical protein
MSATDFLPRREADLRMWSITFNARLQTEYSAYGLRASQAAQYAQAHDAFLTAFERANTPATRTKSAVQMKNDAQKVLRRTARHFARIIHAHPAVSDVQKAELGLTITRGGGKQALLPAPDTRPWLTADVQSGGRVQVRLRDSAQPFRKGRPAGVKGAILQRWCGEHPPDDVKRWVLWAMTTRTRVSLLLPHDVPPGTPIWLTAHWVNPRQEAGPLAHPIRVFTPLGYVSLPVRQAAKAA